MHRTRIKICGIMRPQDASAAAAAGADAIGLIFYKSAPRCITIDRAIEITSVLPPFVTPVGVFVNFTADEIKRTVDQANLTMVQLNGDESPDLVRDLHPIRVIKALHVDPRTLEPNLAAWNRAGLQNLKGIVLEPSNTGQAGGSGVTNDWPTIRRALDNNSFGDLWPIAAGGLTPSNVADVVRQLEPWAVDVSSGVEESKGIKSPEKIRDFIAAVRSVH